MKQATLEQGKADLPVCPQHICRSKACTGCGQAAQHTLLHQLQPRHLTDVVLQRGQPGPLLYRMRRSGCISPQHVWLASSNRDPMVADLEYDRGMA